VTHGAISSICPMGQKAALVTMGEDNGSRQVKHIVTDDHAAPMQERDKELQRLQSKGD
jgi:hypothetical protein